MTDRRLHSRLLLLVGLVVAGSVAVTAGNAPPRAGCERVASPTGADTAAGTATNPWRTPQKLVDSLSAGQTGCLRAGTYRQTRLRVGHGGAPGAPITLTSYPGERATLAGGVVEVASGANHVTLAALDIDGANVADVSLWVMAYDVVIQDSDITNHNTGWSCVILGSNGTWGGPSGRVTVRRNTIRDCGQAARGNQDHGIYLENTVDSTVVANLFWNSIGWAIHLYPNAQRTLVAHNVIDGNGRGVIFGGDGTVASSGNVVEHNVITDSTIGHNVESYWSGPIGTGNLVQGNCLDNGRRGDIARQTGFTATGNTIANPRYLDAANHDYRLPGDSPCLATVGYDTAAMLAGASLPPAGDARGPLRRMVCPSRACYSSPTTSILKSGRRRLASSRPP
jgi:hypothetical protein